MGCHHCTGLAQRWHLVVTSNATVAIVKTIVIVSYLPSNDTKLFLWLCNINEWWRGHRSYTLAHFGRNFVCHVTYLPISPQRRPRFELPYRQSNSKLYAQKNNYVPNPPVELAQCNGMASKGDILDGLSRLTAVSIISRMKVIIDWLNSFISVISDQVHWAYIQ